MTRTRELQLQARKAKDGYVSLGKFIVAPNGAFLPVFGGIEATCISGRILGNATGWKGDKNDRHRAVIASRNRRLTRKHHLSRAYLP